MNELSQLTIVVPTYGRPDYVRRQIEFWDGMQVRLVIADGSPQGVDLSVVPIPKNVTYIHADGDFHTRMLRLAQEVSTDFVAVLGDDDFFSPDGLRRCIGRLNTDTDLVGCVGRSIRFFFQDGRVLAEQRDPESSEFPESVKSGLDRLYATYHPGKIGAMFYGVYRSGPWKEVVETTYSQRFQTGYIYDTIIRSLMTYRGPIGVEDALTWFCSSENPPIKTAPGMNRNVGFVEWLSSQETVDEVNRCISLIVDNLESLNIDVRPDLEFAVEFVFGELRNRYQAKAARNEHWQSRLKRILIAISPQIIRKVGKRLMPDSFRKTFDWTVVDFDAVVQELQSKGVSVSSQDSQRMMNLVHASHRWDF